MKTITRTLIITALLLAPRAAAADWFVFPFAALNSGGDTTRDSGAFGASAGWMGRLVGVEGEAARSPFFFDAADNFRSQHRHTTYTVTGLVGPRMGRLRPYAAFGYGMLRSHIQEVGGLAGIEDERGALHVGGGAMWSVARNVGLRGDVRYLRSTDDEEAAGNVFAERFAELSYWRVGGGVAFTW